MIQGSPEWFAARIGKVTASRISDIMARTKSGPSTSRENYKIELACERLTGRPVGSTYVNGAMKDGIEREPEARAMYSVIYGEVDEVGFIDHPKIPMTGASPDGLVGAEGQVEIKCPIHTTHHRTYRGKSIDAKYMQQIQWQLACTGRQWCDFVSYNPDFPADRQLVVRRVLRDSNMIGELEMEVVAFLKEVETEAAS